MIIALLAAFTFAAGSPLAFAQDKPESKKPSGGAAMPAPTPPPELAQLNSWVGSWKCTSQMRLPPEMGGEQSGAYTIAFKKDLGGYWLVGQMKMGKTKSMPEMKATYYLGYDSVEKKFVELSVDSAGSYMRGVSNGPQSGTWVFNEEETMMGKKMKSRTTITQKTPDTGQLKTEIEAEPGKWVPMSENDCKKQGGRA